MWGIQIEMFRRDLKLRREELEFQLWESSPCDGNELWDWPQWLIENTQQAKGKIGKYQHIR